MAELRRRTFLLTGAVVAAGCESESDPSSQASNETEGTYDFVVIGSGAGGGPLAANLARAGKRVLLLEAGEDRGESDLYQVPALHPQSTEDPTMRWDFFVDHYADEAQAARDSKHTGRGVLYPRAGTLGGCTAHNALITVYPHESDWDHIADITGDDSWRAGNMRRYFEILEHCDYLGKNDDREGHGFGGWLHTRQPDARIALQDPKLLKIVGAAAKEVDQMQGGGFLGSLSESLFHNELLGLMKRDLNSAARERDQAEGLYTVPLHADGGRRNGPREYIVKTVAEGHPLTVKTGAFVTRIVFADEKDEDGNVKAVAVEYVEGKHLYRADPNAGGDGGDRKKVTPKHEIIVSCGTFNTPQLLKLSGVGPRAELEALGIDVRLDLPGVGENLQDRYEVGVVSELDSDFRALNGCSFGGPDDACLVAWRRGQGVYRNNGAVAAIIKRSSDAQADPDLIIFGLPADFRGYYPGYSKDLAADHRHFTWAILKGHTENQAGYVRLRSTDPLDTPEINFRYFHEGTPEAADLDLDAVVEGVKIARRVGRKIDQVLFFSSYEEVWPGTQVETDEELRTWVRDEAWGHHASCTCKIGADDDPMAVLDAQFRVRGATGLRVVDASCFPKIPGFFIVVPVYMLAEKATDDILAAIGEQRS